MKTACISLIFTLSIGMIPAFSQEAITYRIINVTLETSEPTQLQLNQGRLLWHDKDPESGKFNLKYYSGAEIFRLDSGLLGLTSAIDGDFVAWNTSSGEVKVFNCKDWTTQLIGSSYNSDYKQSISLANGKVAFARTSGNGSEIVVRDLLTGGEITLSEGIWNFEPSIDHGQLAWVQKYLADTTLSNIYFYDGQTTQLLSNTGSAKNLNPVLKDGQVIWIQILGGTGSAKLFDGDSVLTLVETGPDEIISGYDLSNGIAVASITDTISDYSEVSIYNTETKTFFNILGYRLISGLHIDNGLIAFTSGSGAERYLRLCYINTGLIEEWGGAQSPVVDDGQIAWTLGDAVSLMIPFTALQLSSGIENGWPQSRFKNNDGKKVIWGNIDNSTTARLFYSDGDSVVQLTDSSVYKDFIMMNDGYAIWRHDFTSLYLYNGSNPPELIIDSLQCENMYLADGSIGFHGFKTDAGNNVNQAWIYRINTGNLIQLTYDDSVNVMNTFTLVDEDNACWYRDSSGISMLMLYDGISKIRLTDSVVNNEFGFREGKIVWSERQNGVFQIMLYNLQTLDKKQLTEGPNNTYKPETDGSVVVWFEDTPSGTIMWYYDLASGKAHKVAHHKPPVARWLWLSNGKVAWSFSGEICVYDGNVISRLTDSAPYYLNAEPYVDNEVVVWNKNNPEPNTNHYGQVFLAKLHAHVDFDAENITGNAPLTVSFLNNSFQGVRSYHWDFGDGQTGTDKDPVHLYQEPGVYSVTLTAEGLTGPIPEKKINLVRVNTPTLINETTSEGVKEVILYQNYPNPFNSSTTISYSIPASYHVNLTVYDLLGNEISTLVNEKQVPGTYEVDFNAGDLASGIYIYRLSVKAGNSNYVVSKILHLIK